MTAYSPIVRALAALTPLHAKSIAESIEIRRMLVDRWRVGFHLNNTEATTWHAYNCTDRCAPCSVIDTGNTSILPKGASVVTDDNGIVAITLPSCRSCLGSGRVANVQLAWETLATAGVIPESWLDDDSRSFVCATCIGSGGSVEFEDGRIVIRKCLDCDGLGFGDRPTTMPSMLALLANGSASMLRAEEIIRAACVASGDALARVEWLTKSRAAISEHHRKGAATTSLHGVFSSECNRRDGNDWPVECDWQDEAIRAAWKPLRDFAVGTEAKPSPTGFHLLYCFNGTARIAVESLGK
jgi:hypothetical protein